MREIPSLSIASPSMMSREPEGVNLPQDYSCQLEPSGSHYDDEQHILAATVLRESDDIATADFCDKDKRQILLEMKKIIGLPPPPPTSVPPKRKTKNSKQGSNQANTSTYLSGTSSSEQNSMLKSELSEADVRDDCANTNKMIESRSSSSSRSPSSSPRNRLKVEKSDGIVTDDIDCEEKNLLHNELNCLITSSDDAVIPRDTRASPTARNQGEELVTEVASHTDMTKRNLNLSHDITSGKGDEGISSSLELKMENQKRTKKRGFLKKLFGGGKNREHRRTDQKICNTSPVAFIPASQESLLVSAPTDQINDSLSNVEILTGTDQVQPMDERLRVSSMSSEATDKVLNDLSSNIEVIADNKSIEDEQSVVNVSLESQENFQEFSLDPPDNDNGDPPEISGRPLLSPSARRRNALYSHTSLNDEEEQKRIENVRSKIAEFYSGNEGDAMMNLGPKSLSIPQDGDFECEASDKKHEQSDHHDPKVTDSKILLRVETDKNYSKEPLGTSPALHGNEERNYTNRLITGDPNGETPKARENAKISSNDPVGASFCHASITMKSLREDETVDVDVDNFDANVADYRNVGKCEDENNFDMTGGSLKSNSRYNESSVEHTFENPEFVSPGKDQLVSQSSTNKVTNSLSIELSIDTDPVTKEQASLDAEKDAFSEKIEIDIERSGFKSASIQTACEEPLTVSAAALTNAKAIAYIHRLQGEPSPRFSWHSKKAIAPPLSEKSIALAKIRAFNSKLKKGKVENTAKTKSPSPDEYSATHSKIEAMIKEKTYINHDPSKCFAPYSRFKGRRPKRKNIPKLESPPHDMLAMPLQELIQPKVDIELIIPSGKISELALARGTELKQIKRKACIQPGSTALVAVTATQKPTGGNRFNFFPANESEIKEPIQRAGRRLLSKAAIPIQAGFRMFLSRREAMDKMWAIIQIQSYFRRWRCAANLHTHKQSAKLVQKIYRGYRGREVLKNRNRCATSMQKIVRGYLAALRAYETIYYISRAQALARGFLVRISNARRAETLKEKDNAAFLIQKCYRDYISRKNATLMEKKCATVIQSVWRSFSARVTSKMYVVHVITVQSVIRRRAAIREANLMKKAIYSTAITRFQAVWRDYAERKRHQKSIAAKKIQRLWSSHVANREFKNNKAATKIQASWRGFQAYTDFIFVIVDILVVQRSARQWLAVRKTKKLRRERSATVLQSAWRRKRAQENLLYSMVHIIVVQSMARQFLAKNEVEIRRKEREEKDSVQRGKNAAATTIQKTWRGFWGFSHFVIVQYEITRVQALVRGKLARDRFNLKLGCAILIQAVSRRFLARKLASAKVTERATASARVLELRERNSAKHIQFWWRIVLDWMKEKRAALIIERFFMSVKAEVDRELNEMEQRRILNEKSRKNNQKVSKRPNAVDAFAASRVLTKTVRSQSAPRSRPAQKNIPIDDANNYKLLHSRDERCFLEISDTQSPPQVLHLAPSEDFSMISNITNPSILNQFSKDVQSPSTGQTNSEEIFHEVRAPSKNEKHRRLSTEDYIKKYGGLKTAPNKSLSKFQSDHFFPDNGKSGRKKNRRSYDGMPTIQIQGQNKVKTPSNARGQYGKPMPLSTESSNSKVFQVIKTVPATPRSSSGGGNRSSPVPRNATRSRRDIIPSQFHPPVTPTRKKSAALLRSATALTECSTPVEDEKLHIPPRPRPSQRKHSSIHGRGGSAVMIMKTNPDFKDDKTIEEAHEIMLLGDDYGEV